MIMKIDIQLIKVPPNILVPKDPKDPSGEQKSLAIATILDRGIIRKSEYLHEGFPTEEEADLGCIPWAAETWPTKMLKQTVGQKTIRELSLKRGRWGFPTGISITRTPMEVVSVIAERTT